MTCYVGGIEIELNESLCSDEQESITRRCAFGEVLSEAGH